MNLQKDVPTDPEESRQVPEPGKEEASSEKKKPPYVPNHMNKRYISDVGFIVNKVVHLWKPESGQPYSERAPASLDDLDFEPQPMVGWYRPSELVKAGIEVVLSSIFGAYADKREVESVLTEEEWYDYTDHLKQNDEIWVDYIADLGDGWDSTYTMARLLAEPQLRFDDQGRARADASDLPVWTQRGNVLVMGGDEVYPTANREEYNNRIVQPYRCALPFVERSGKAPHLYLIPGNHDWYDGLNSFFNIFCQRKWVGGWRTWQSRSYFAMRLDEKLWLWGIDIQLNSNIDQPQLNYFKHVAIEQMAKGSKIILCTAEPSWVYVDANTKEKTGIKKEKKKEEIYQNLGHLENKIIKKYGHEVVVGLAGDWHNYTRYESVNGDKHQRFVSGGGGAYLYPTHNMPRRLKLPKKHGGAEYERKEIFPSEKDSKKLAHRSLLFPFFPWNLWMTLFLGVFYLLLSWIIQSVSVVTAGGDSSISLLAKYAEKFDLSLLIDIVLHSPGSVVLIAILVLGLIAFSGYESWLKKFIHGGLHGLAHIALFLLLFTAFAKFNLNNVGLGMDDLGQALLFSAEMLVFGGFFGGVIFGLYLWISNRFFKIHDNEVLLCQSNPDFKNFLRLRIEKNGQITIFPIGVRQVNRTWTLTRDKTERRLAAWSLQPNAKGGAAWFEPKEGKIQDFAELIEDPITIRYKDVKASASEPEVPVSGDDPQATAPEPEVPVSDTPLQATAPEPEVPVSGDDPQATAPEPEVPQTKAVP